MSEPIAGNPMADEMIDALTNTLALARIKWGNLDPDANVVFAKAEAALARISRPSITAVKPLEWWTDNVDWWAYPYRIRVDKGTPDLFIVSGWQSGTNPYETLDAAKAAAQADYEQRIRSALVRPSITADAWHTVPHSPSMAMLNAAVDHTGAGSDMDWNGLSPQSLFQRAWYAMLAAAPAHPAPEGAGEDEHQNIHLYDGDSALVIRQFGNKTLYGVQLPELLALFEGAGDTFDARENLHRILNECTIPTEPELSMARETIARLEGVGDTDRDDKLLYNRPATGDTETAWHGTSKEWAARGPSCAKPIDDIIAEMQAGDTRHAATSKIRCTRSDGRLKDEGQISQASFQLRQGKALAKVRKFAVAEKDCEADHARGCQGREWEDSARVNRARAELAEQRVAALDGALNHVHNWIANTYWGPDELAEAQTIDNIVLEAINYAEAPFDAALRPAETGEPK